MYVAVCGVLQSVGDYGLLLDASWRVPNWSVHAKVLESLYTPDDLHDPEIRIHKLFQVILSADIPGDVRCAALAGSDRPIVALVAARWLSDCMIVLVPMSRVCMLAGSTHRPRSEVCRQVGAHSVAIASRDTGSLPHAAVKAIPAHG